MLKRVEVNALVPQINVLGIIRQQKVPAIPNFFLTLPF